MLSEINLTNIDLSLGLEQITDPLSMYEQGCTDLLVKDPSNELGFSQIDRVLHNKSQYIKLDDNALNQFYQRLRIPVSYLSRCPHELQLENVSYWLSQQKKSLLFRLRNYSVITARGVLSKRFVTTEATKDDIKALPLILQVQQNQYIEDPLFVASLDKSDRFTSCVSYFKPHIGTHEHGTFTPGLMITNSEVGLASLKVQPVIAEFRENKPDNYYISSSPLGVRRFYHVGMLTPEKLLEAVSSAGLVAQNGVVQLLIRAHEEVDNPSSVIRSLLSSKALLGVTSSKLSEEVEDLWKETPSATKLDIARSIMDATRHLDQLDHYKISRVVGKYLGIFVPA